MNAPGRSQAFIPAARSVVGSSIRAPGRSQAFIPAARSGAGSPVHAPGRLPPGGAPA